MGEYVGEIGSKLNLEVIYKKRCEYYTHFGYSSTLHNVHIFEDALGNVIVWDSQNFLEDKNFIDQWGQCRPIWEGSKITLKGTVKDHCEYNGTKQTKIKRASVTVIELAKSPDEMFAEKDKSKQDKVQSQLDSLKGEDFLWEMPYKQYKEHYSDCETVYDSFKHKDGESSLITVIIREGRLKASGVRGKHFSSFVFKNEDNQSICYLAVSKENALRRVRKDFPEHNWECIRIF